MTNNKLKDIYYSPQGYWRGETAVKKLSTISTVTSKEARDWLKKQAIWQIYLPSPKHIPRPKFDIKQPNEVHQADLLFLLHDTFKQKTYKYALTVVDVASCYKEAEPLTSKDSSEVMSAFETIYKCSPIKYPRLLQVDPGREFMGVVSNRMEKQGTKIRRGTPQLHRDQGIVERFNRTLAERLFAHQYAQEFVTRTDSREWVARLPDVIKNLNNEESQLIGKKPRLAVKLMSVKSQPSTPAKRPVGMEEKKLRTNALVRYLYQSGELEKDSRRRATDPVWSVSVHTIERSVTKNDEPVLYYLVDAPPRGFVREELQVVPVDTEMPPAWVI